VGEVSILEHPMHLNCEDSLTVRSASQAPVISEIIGLFIGTKYGYAIAELLRGKSEYQTLGSNPHQPGDQSATSKNPQPLLHPTAEDSLYMSLLLDPD